jgi:toxin ParE1/3/4
LNLRLFPSAKRDLVELRAYIAADSPSAAEAVSARLAKAMLLTAEKPGIGRATPDRPTREWSVPGLHHLIVYRVNGDVVEFLRLWHTSRERPSEW